MIARRSWLGINSAHDRIKSETPHVAKPDPRVYHLTCDRMQLKPFEAVLLDDVPANLEAARAVGMQAVLHRETPESVAELNALLDSPVEAE